jgi:hypothetical protein
MEKLCFFDPVVMSACVPATRCFACKRGAGSTRWLMLKQGLDSRKMRFSALS